MTGGRKKLFDHCRKLSGGDYSFLDRAWVRRGCEWSREEVEAKLAGAVLVKDSRSTTAGKAGCGFIKRYNRRGWFHALRRRLRTPRPWYCLGAALSLKRAGIATPEVLWAGRDYLVTGLLPEEAATLDKVEPLPGPELGELLAAIHRAGVYHGDMNLRNLYCARGGYGVIDLDGARVYGAVPLRLRRRDMARLISSWLKAARLAGWSGVDRGKVTGLFLERYLAGGGGEIAGGELNRRVDYLADRIRRD